MRLLTVVLAVFVVMIVDLSPMTSRAADPDNIQVIRNVDAVAVVDPAQAARREVPDPPPVVQRVSELEKRVTLLEKMAAEKAAGTLKVVPVVQAPKADKYEIRYANFLNAVETSPYVSSEPTVKRYILVVGVVGTSVVESGRYATVCAVPSGFRKLDDGVYDCWRSSSGPVMRPRPTAAMPGPMAFPERKSSAMPMMVPMGYHAHLNNDGVTYTIHRTGSNASHAGMSTDVAVKQGQYLPPNAVVKSGPAYAAAETMHETLEGFRAAFGQKVSSAGCTSAGCVKSGSQSVRMAWSAR